MAGDVGLLAKLLSEVFGFIVNPDGYEQLSRENQLKFMMRGINESIAKNDWGNCDKLFAHYNELLRQVGP